MALKGRIARFWSPFNIHSSLQKIEHRAVNMPPVAPLGNVSAAELCLVRFESYCFGRSLQVTGCGGHVMNRRRLAMVRDPNVFSMSNLRDVTARIVSAFFYTPPHSPRCASAEEVVGENNVNNNNTSRTNMGTWRICHENTELICPNIRICGMAH